MQAAITDLSDPLSLPVSIVHRSREVFQAISWIGTEQLYRGSSWTSYFCSSMFRGPPEYISLISSFLLLQQCPTCLVRPIVLVFMMGGRWPYSCCFVGCCLQDLFSTARSILVYLASIFFSICLLSVHVVPPYSSIGTTVAGKNCSLFYRSGQTFMCNYTYVMMKIICRHIFEWLWVFLPNTNHLLAIKCFQDFISNTNNCPQFMVSNISIYSVLPRRLVH